MYSERGLNGGSNGTNPVEPKRNKLLQHGLFLYYANYLCVKRTTNAVRPNFRRGCELSERYLFKHLHMDSTINDGIKHYQLYEFIYEIIANFILVPFT